MGPVHDFQEGNVVVLLSVEGDDEKDVFVEVLKDGQVGRVHRRTQSLDLLYAVLLGLEERRQRHKVRITASLMNLMPSLKKH